MDHRKRLAEAEKATTEDLVKTWERQAETYAPYLNRHVDFVTVDWQGMYDRRVGWLPRGKEARIVSGVRENSPADASFQLKSGLASTVLNLWVARESAAEQALAWIAATMHPLTKHVREKWRGEAGAHRIAEIINNKIRRAGYDYHHAVNSTLPVELPEFAMEHPPTYLWDFIALSVVQAALVLANYTPGIICDLDMEQRCLERRKEDLGGEQ
jgi:hypothetical protein